MKNHPAMDSWTRRRFLTRAGALVATSALAAPVVSVRGFSGAAIPGAPTVTIRQVAPVAAPLLDGVSAVCARLADAGWRDLLLAASDGQLDISAGDLAAALAQPLPTIDRSLPGFEDFAV